MNDVYAVVLIIKEACIAVFFMASIFAVVRLSLSKKKDKDDQ